MPHVPDGVLVLPDGRRVAVELECSAKGTARYRAVLGWYAGTMAYDRVRWFVEDARLRERLAALVRAERLDDLVSVGAVAGAPTAPGRSPPGSAAGRVGEPRGANATSGTLPGLLEDEEDPEVEDLPEHFFRRRR